MITAQAHSASNQQPLPMMTTQAYPAYSQVSQQPPSYDPPAGQGQGQMVVDSKACWLLKAYICTNNYVLNIDRSEPAN